MFRLFSISLVFLLGGCQTVQQKNMSLLKDRAEKLAPLSEWKSSWCQVETELTQPALARFKQMFPSETEKLIQPSWAYTWKAREATCEVTPLDASPLTKNHQGFLDTSFCLLLQVHYVNSPFDELKVAPDDIKTSGEQVHIRSGSDEDLGIYLPRDKFVVETRTRSRGVLIATYEDRDGQWLPSRIEQRRNNTEFVIEDIHYADPVPGKRRMIESFWIAVGDERALRHSQVKIKGCRDL